MSSEESLWTNALSAAAKEIGNPVTPTDLLRLGMTRVRLVTKENMAALLERAVEKALRERSQDANELFDHVQVGLLGLLRGARDIESASRGMAETRAELQGELDEIAQEREQGASDEARNDTPIRHDDLQAAIAERDDKIQRLERRVAKLLGSLEAAEHALQRARVTGDLDTGIASLYRFVQGLPSTDPDVARKHALMADIFQANLEFRSARAPTREPDGSGN